MFDQSYYPVVLLGTPVRGMAVTRNLERKAGKLLRGEKSWVWVSRRTLKWIILR